MREIQRQRLQVLASLAQGKTTVVVCPIEALAKNLLPPDLFKKAIRNIHVGQVVDLSEFMEYLVQYGYERVEQVEGPGQFSIRGGIIDIYSVLYEHPLRLEFLMMK